MANLLFLVHRMPYPPNKGDKVRSYHLLQHLRARHQVHLGTFIDDPEDEVHLQTLGGLCSSLHVARLSPLLARIASLKGLFSGDALTLHYYRDAGLRRWVDQTMLEQRIDATVVFSSSMAQYAQHHPTVPMWVDLVDVDSAKWTDYAPNHRWPLSWLYAREGRCLLECERQLARLARQTFLATEKEAELFRRLAPESSAHTEAMNNGVDANYFAPEPSRESPFAAEEAPLVFTGAMDYWPNVDAVIWFVRDALPALRQRWPSLRFYIVGRSPTAAVRALAGDAVVVTGTVPDVRPYLQHAAVVVAPLRLARGIQNKILEAMAMGRPVVAAAACVEALSVKDGTELVSARQADDFVREVDLLLRDKQRAAAIGAAGRQRVLAAYTWEAHMAVLDRHLDALSGARA